MVIVSATNTVNPFGEGGKGGGGAAPIKNEWKNATGRQRKHRQAEDHTERRGGRGREE